MHVRNQSTRPVLFFFFWEGTRPDFCLPFVGPHSTISVFWVMSMTKILFISSTNINVSQKKKKKKKLIGLEKVGS